MVQTKGRQILTLLGQLQEFSALVAYGFYIKVLFLDPSVNTDFLSQYFVSLDILLVLPPSSVRRFLVSSPPAARLRFRRWNGWRKCLGVQSVHDQLLHALSSVVEFCIGNGPPYFTLRHLLTYEFEKVADDLDLLVYHPLFLAEFEKKRSQELCDRIRGAMSKLLQEAMEIEGEVWFRIWFEWRRFKDRGRWSRRGLLVPRADFEAMKMYGEEVIVRLG